MSGELSQASLAVMLAWSVCLGFVGALAYDVFRIRRKAIKIPLLPHIEDFLFMLFFGAAMAVVLYVQNSGRVRWFVFAGAICGFYIYRKTLGRLVMAASDKIINFVKFLVRRFVVPPLLALKKALLGAANAVWQALSRAFAKLESASGQRRTKRYIRTFSAAALGGFGDTNVKIKESRRLRKNK